ncbi:MAG TPA: TetR/AcrR family transcriptional regulator [Zeimonas sp.]|nr:TetR/AcrR family transcriptional regulator [Zeimonas sp.]
MSGPSGPASRRRGAPAARRSSPSRKASPGAAHRHAEPSPDTRTGSDAPEPPDPQRSPVKARVGDEALVAQRRRQIVAAAVELFSSQGYYRTTVQEIAARAGISTGLVYQYVEDKDDVLLLAILDVVDAYGREIPAALENVADPLERFRTAVRTYCGVVDRLRDATVLAYRSTRSLSPSHRKLVQQAELQSNELIAATVRACIDAGVFADDVDVEFLTHQAVTFAHSWALKHWRLSPRYTLDEYVERGLAMFLRASLRV